MIMTILTKFLNEKIKRFLVVLSSTDSHTKSIVKWLFSLVFGGGAIVLTFNDISTCEKNHFSVRKCKQCEFNGTINTTVLTMTWWRDGTLSIMIKIKILFSSMIWSTLPAPANTTVFGKSFHSIFTQNSPFDVRTNITSQSLTQRNENKFLIFSFTTKKFNFLRLSLRCYTVYHWHWNLTTSFDTQKTVIWFRFDCVYVHTNCAVVSSHR